MSQTWMEDKVTPVTILEIADSEDKNLILSLKEGEKVKVSGKSKGKGFQGVVKRYGFAGGPKSHGQKDKLRTPGSIGSRYPQRVVPGRKMPGRMGSEKVTVKNLMVVKLDQDKRTVFLKGAVPGTKGSVVYLMINSADK